MSSDGLGSASSDLASSPHCWLPPRARLEWGGGVREAEGSGLHLAGWTMVPSTGKNLLNGPSVCRKKVARSQVGCKPQVCVCVGGVVEQDRARGQAEEDSVRVFAGLTLMPCGLYSWLAARLSLYPPV